MYKSNRCNARRTPILVIPHAIKGRLRFVYQMSRVLFFPALFICSIVIKNSNLVNLEEGQHRSQEKKSGRII